MVQTIRPEFPEVGLSASPRPERRSFHHQAGMRMLEAGERQPEVIEPVIECFTRDGNPERACVAEVG